MEKEATMKSSHLTLGIAFFFGLMASQVFVSDARSVPPEVSQTDKGFMTDRLLDRDLDRGAVPLKDRDRDKKPKEQPGKHRLKSPHSNGRDLRK